MKIAVALISFFMLTSCLKKIDGVDSLNTNIYDKDYAGDCWFTVTDCYTFYNDFGFPRVMVEAMIPEANMPGLKPNLVFVSCQVNDQQEILFNAYIDEDGNYPFYFDAAPETPASYCLEAGIYLVEEDTSINVFTVCTQP